MRHRGALEGLGGIESGRGGFSFHGTGWRLQSDEQADFRFLPLHTSFQCGDLLPVDMTAFHLRHDALGLAAVVVEEVDIAIYPGDRTLLSAPGGAGVYETQRPPLELVTPGVFAVGGEGLGTGDVLGLAQRFVGFEFVLEGVLQAVADEGDGDVGDVYANPAAVEALGGGDGGAAPQKGSSTTSPSLLLALTMRSSRASGFWVG